MKVYIFRCRTRPRKYGASRYETGSNLPKDQCSGIWEFCERLDFGTRVNVRFEVDTNTLVSHVRRFGWFVWDETPRESPRSSAQSKPVLREQYQPVVERETAAAKEVPAPVREVAPPAVLREVRPARSAPVVPVARHQVVWFDIPVRDLDRALRFYSAVLGAQLKKEQAGPGMSMAMLPQADGFVSGCLLQNADAKPSESGPLLYLNTHGRLDEAIEAVETHNGRVLSARHSIAPFGFRAIVLDSEGNRVALHSNE